MWISCNGQSVFILRPSDIDDAIAYVSRPRSFLARLAEAWGDLRDEWQEAA